MLAKLMRNAPLTSSVVGLAALTLVIKGGRTRGWDRRWSRRVGNGKPLALDVSKAAEPKAALVEALVLAALPRLRGRERLRALAGPLLAGVAGHALKRFVPRRRPSWAGWSKNGDESFPSTHAANAASLALTAARLARDHGAGGWADAGAAALIAAIAFARLRAKAHWPTDVLAGTLLGVACARLAQGAAPPPTA